ncbi:insulinase family protein [Candidatus Saccharibacteria bacterium]|nr:insulinase family protein [Candidatus Saccharibacteria bacterium]
MKHTVEEVRLKNGARGLLIDVPDATVMSFEFQFRAGNRYVKDKNIYETAHIMEHMSFGANVQFATEHEFEQEFTKNGAYHNAFTSDLSMVYMADCADFEWERILKLQEVSICQPLFNEDELKAEKGNVRSELTGYLNNHARLLWPKSQQLLGENVLTFNQRLKTISNVTLDDIKEHHRRTHTGDNMRFVIAGKLSGRKAAIKRYLEGWKLPRGERFSVPHDELHSANPAIIRRKEASNVTFGWSMILPRVLSNEEFDAMACLNHLLTGTMHSRIFGTARKKGLAYGMFSDTSIGFYESSWDFGGQVNQETASALFDIIKDQLHKVLNGDISEKELDAVKSYALGRHQMGAQTVAQVSSFYTGRYFSDREIRSYDSVPKSIANTTRERMVETAKDFIKADTWVLTAVSAGEKDDVVELSNKLEGLFAINS